MKNNLVARVPARAKVLVAALLAILLIAGLVPVGLNLAAKAVQKDGFTTALSEDEVVLNGGNALTVGQVYRAPQAIRAGQWVTYVYGDNTYAFQPQFPIAEGEELTLTDENTIQLNRQNSAPAGTTNIETIATAKSNADGQVVFELKDDALMTADTLYYYDDGSKCYTFSTPIDLGYKAGTDVARYSDANIARTRRTNLNGQVNAKGQSTDGTGNITIVLNINGETGTANFEGNQFTKHYIYERATSLSAGQVYLIGRRTSSENGKVKTYLVSQQTLGGNSATASLGYETPGADASMWDMGADGVIAAPSSNHSYFIDSADLTGEEYALSEHLAQTASTANNALTAPFGIKLNLLNKSGVQFQAVNSAKNGYATDRVFGTDYTWSDTEQCNMQYLPFGDGTDTISALGFGGQLAKNNGQVWSLEQSSGSYYLQNNNTFAGLSSGNAYLVVNASSLSAASSTDAATPVYPYQLKVAYKQQTATLSEDIALVAQSKTTTDFTATRMEKVSGTFSYIGTKGADKKFDITYRLTDADGNPVSGTFGDVTFAKGTGTMTGVANGDTFNLGWIPQGYKLATVSVLPSDTSDPDAKRYQKKLYYTDEEAFPDAPNWAEGNANALTIPAAPTQLKYEVNDPLRNVKIGLTHNGTGSHLSDTFSVTPYITDKTGAPFTGEFHDRFGRTFVFENGKPNAATQKYLTLGKDRNVTLVDVPNGYRIALTTASTDMANVSISEGNSGESRILLQKSDSTETIGKAVTSWTVKDITVDADEDFLVNIQYQNYTTTVEYHYTGYQGEHTFDYEYTFTVKQPDDDSPNGWKNVTDIGFKESITDKTGNFTCTQNADGSFTVKRTGIQRSKEQDIIYDNLTISNIPPDAKLFVNHSSAVTFSNNRQSAVLQLYVDSNLTDITKQIFDSNLQSTFSLPRQQPEFELDPGQKKHILVNEFSKGIGIARYNVRTTLLHGDPTLSVPVNLTGFMYTALLPASGNVRDLTRDQKIMSDSNATDGELYTTRITVNSDALIKQYAVGSANATTLKVEEIRRGGTGVSMKMDDSLSFSFSEDGNQNYAAYISPFIATKTANANGVKFNTLNSELTAQPGYQLKNILFAKGKTKSVSNPETSVAYEEFAQKNEIVGDIEIVYDIIPQEVHISLFTGKNDGAKDYANRQKKFPVDITLLDSSDMPVDGQIYEYTDENGNDSYLLFNSEEGVQILENVNKDSKGKITSYDETGKKPELKHGDEIVLKLPYQYTVVVNEENLGSYTDTYQAWTDTAPTKVAQNHVKVDSVLESQNSYLQITNTRNDVEDDIGLFGGKANKAFLALVATLTTIAVAAYICSKRYTETED